MLRREERFQKVDIDDSYTISWEEFRNHFYPLFLHVQLQRDARRIKTDSSSWGMQENSAPSFSTLCLLSRRFLGLPFSHLNNGHKDAQAMFRIAD